MKKILLLLMMAGIASASITNVTGPDSSMHSAAQIIAAPDDVLDDGTTNTCMQGFDEAQDVVLNNSYAVDKYMGTNAPGTIAAGTKVDSHMIFLNSYGTDRLTHNNVVWTFDGVILGVMSNASGSHEYASTNELGADGTLYETSMSARGLEGGDSYSISGNQLTITMVVTEPGDWIRVVTASPIAVPAPGALLLSTLGTAVVGRFRRRI